MCVCPHFGGIGFHSISIQIRFLFFSYYFLASRSIICSLDIISIPYIDERVGQLCCIVNTSEAATAVRSQLLQFCRALWSNPPNHGARIVTIALNNPSLKQEWYVLCLFVCLFVFTDYLVC